MREVLTDDKARQGPRGRPVLGVLIGGLALCAVAIGGYLVWVGMTSPDAPGQNASRNAVTGSPSGSTSNPSDRTPAANPSYPQAAQPSATGSTAPRP
jgi:hypothetical protein